MLKIFDDWYRKGYDAGVTAQKLEQREDFERRLTEMYHFGIAMGRQEMMDEIGEIDISDIGLTKTDINPENCEGVFDDNCPGCPSYWDCPKADASFVLDDIATAEEEVRA